MILHEPLHTYVKNNQSYIGVLFAEFYHATAFLILPQYIFNVSSLGAKSTFVFVTMQDETKYPFARKDMRIIMLRAK